MLSINLKAQDEYQWRGENPSPATFPQEKDWYPLYHQWLTYNAEKPIIVNTYNTGTGKTKAALLRLLKRARDVGFDKLTPISHNALLIAPTNELLAQHVADAKKFCEENGLPYRVTALTKDDLERYKNTEGFSEDRLRRGAALHAILNDASKVDDDYTKRATLYVVNPDIFYYAVLFCYQRFDGPSLFRDFFGLFNYIIIDEFHYYNPKQLTAFLFFMKYSQHQGYIDNVGKKRQFCILTATPRPQVTDYLNGLGIPIAWIRPGEIDPADEPDIQPVRALTSVQLQVYHTEELQQDDAQGGLLQLAQQQQATLQTWLDQGLEGAIISSSLGTVNRIHELLRSNITDAEMGRITGAEKRAERNAAKEKPLILATPTVDIGYNFDRSRPKPRQNIDFLLLDAFSGDELVQRIGRAGRVLAAEERDHPSFVIVAVDPAAYKLLEAYDGKELERPELARIADSEEMPKRNDLYAYIKTGAILEVFRPIMFIGQGTATENMPNLETFLQDIQKLFGVKRPFTYRQAQYKVREFEDRKKHYGELKTIPQEAFNILRLKVDKKPVDVPEKLEKCLKAFVARLGSVGKPVGRKGYEVVQWLQRDLRNYFVDQARFSFRDSFQPPLALVYDPDHLHSSKDVAFYNALHIARYYEARYFSPVSQWEEYTGKDAPAESKDALAFCHLRQFREKPLQIGFKLNANEYTQDEWEEQFAYQVTALYGLEVVSLSDNRGLDPTLQSLFQTQFIPAFAALNEARSSTASAIRRLQRQARFFPVQMDVTFCDGKTLTYLVILGTMAFQVCAEIPYRAIAIDRHKTQLMDDRPFIC
ncbi:MAG: type I-D CRISPR-associated helicase Cas3' [Ktedonobacteraceae bacterium]